VPTYFSKVGLTAEQKERIYSIRGKHQAEMEELKRRLEEGQSKELAECESVLNDAQKKQLEQFRATAKSRTKSAAKSDASPN
jgi:hypothetical protein